MSAGFYVAPFTNSKHPKIQILTIEELLHGKGIDMPASFTTFKQAERVKSEPEAKMVDMFGDL